ncbi:hypothetical protein LCGC14_0328080 [marine sediment metagenome]|uniref:Uncharacterized protein n=1 Tax=marine sediment metagenome TaxID=412755 RepID=A0A0F9TMV1_9ZZZZ
MLTKKMISLIVGISFASAFIASIPSAVNNINIIKDRQLSANQRLAEWKAAYQALQPVNAVWERTFTSADNTNDLVELYRGFDLERYGLMVNADTISQTGSEVIRVQGIDVGLQKLCIGNQGNFLTVKANNIGQLRQGLRSVSERKDISIGSVAIGFDKDSRKPFAEVNDFCLKVRT